MSLWLLIYVNMNNLRVKIINRNIVLKVYIVKLKESMWNFENRI